MTDTLFALDPAADLDRLINDVLMGRSGPWVITDLQREILRILRYHKGAANPKPLVRFKPLSDREVKAAVKSLVEDFGLPIGASRQEPYGYFFCVTPDDVEHALRPLQNELISIARRVRILGGSQRIAEIFGQVRAEMEKGS